MKNLMLLMSLIVLVSCNGKDADNIRRALEEDAYSQEEEDSLNCNEDILGWAAEVPRNLQQARQSLEENPEFKQCGNFKLYIDEVLEEHPQARYLKGVYDYVEETNGETTPGIDTKNDLTEEQIEALNCNEAYLGLLSNPPADSAEAKERMVRNPEYTECGFFNLYIEEVIFSNPEASFLNKLIKK